MNTERRPPHPCQPTTAVKLDTIAASAQESLFRLHRLLCNKLEAIPSDVEAIAIAIIYCVQITFNQSVTN